MLKTTSNKSSIYCSVLQQQHHSLLTLTSSSPSASAPAPAPVSSICDSSFIHTGPSSYHDPSSAKLYSSYSSSIHTSSHSSAASDYSYQLKKIRSHYRSSHHVAMLHSTHYSTLTQNSSGLDHTDQPSLPRLTVPSIQHTSSKLLDSVSTYIEPDHLLSSDSNNEYISKLHSKASSTIKKFFQSNGMGESIQSRLLEKIQNNDSDVCCYTLLYEYICSFF